MQKISRNADNGIAYDNARGSALFFRSWSFYQLAQAFAPLHNKATAATDLGIPLRLSADVNTPSTRASLEATYKQVLGDLKASVALLPVTPAFKTRLSKPAAYALLARVYLSMQDYPMPGCMPIPAWHSIILCWIIICLTPRPTYLFQGLMRKCFCQSGAGPAQQ